MADKKPIFGDVKSRNVFVLTIGISVLMVGAALFLSGGGEKEEGMQSQVTAPTKTNNKPGGNNSPRYQQYVKDENIDRAEEAENTGGSAIPTIFSGAVSEEPFIVEEEEPEVPSFEPYISPFEPETAQPAQEKVVAEVAIPREIDKALQSQMRALMISWSEDPGIEGRNFKVASIPEPVTMNTVAQKEVAPVKLMYRAGSMISAVIDTELSTDYPGAVRATIVSGPLRGAYVIGGFKRQRDTVLLEFSAMSIAGVGSKGVSFVAVDPKTGNSGIKSDVDHHYLSRYASLMGGVFVSSLGIYGEMTSQENTQATTDLNGNVVVTRNETDEAEKIKASIAGGFVSISENAGEEVAAGFRRDVTVTVNQGAAIKLFVLQDIPESILQ